MRILILFGNLSLHAMLREIVSEIIEVKQVGFDIVPWLPPKESGIKTPHTVYDNFKQNFAGRLITKIQTDNFLERTVNP